MYLKDNPEAHHNVREWVLAISMDQKIEQVCKVEKAKENGHCDLIICRSSP